jgi:hypothetical protein
MKRDVNHAIRALTLEREQSEKEREWQREKERQKEMEMAVILRSSADSLVPEYLPAQANEWPPAYPPSSSVRTFSSPLRINQSSPARATSPGRVTTSPLRVTSPGRITVVTSPMRATSPGRLISPSRVTSTFRVMSPGNRMSSPGEAYRTYEQQLSPRQIEGSLSPAAAYFVPPQGGAQHPSPARVVGSPRQSLSPRRVPSPRVVQVSAVTHMRGSNALSASTSPLPLLPSREGTPPAARHSLSESPPYGDSYGDVSARRYGETFDQRLRQTTGTSDISPTYLPTNIQLVQGFYEGMPSFIHTVDEEVSACVSSACL